MSSNTCVCCNDEIPEGRQVCPVCEGRTRNIGDRSRRGVPWYMYLITKLFERIRRAL